MSKKVFELDFRGRKLVIEQGEYAKQADGAVLVRYGDTVILSTAVVSDNANILSDFFPLMVLYQEKLYSVGKIPGGFIKREGRPTDAATLAARMIDRPMRPMFPEDFRNEVQVVNTVLSVDTDNSPELAAMFGSSLATSISQIPFDGPIAGVKVGKIPGGFIKREGRPTDAATLAARMIDRPMRPMFPEDFRNEVQVVNTVLSVDTDNSPELAAMFGSSLATSISQIPFDGPIAGVKVGRVNGEFIINPTPDELEKSDIDLTVAGTTEAINMVEAGSKEDAKAGETTISVKNLQMALEEGNGEAGSEISVTESNVKITIADSNQNNGGNNNGDNNNGNNNGGSNNDNNNGKNGNVKDGTVSNKEQHAKTGVVKSALPVVITILQLLFLHVVLC